METYSILRQFADSWALLLMFSFFVAVILWAFRPGGRSAQSESANLIFRNEASPDDTSRVPNPKEAAQ